MSAKLPPAGPDGAPPATAGQGGEGAGQPGEALPRKFGKYTLMRRLATGGMAELFLALHRSMAGFEKLIVVKRVLPELSKDTAFITMLLQEARIAATFSHPNIVTIFDVGQVDGQYFIAMEHIHGEDLRSIVRAMKPKGVTEFPLEHAIALTLGVAAGLAYAHERTDLNGKPLNIVHRDISPQNVLVTFTGDVKVVDFGIAKAARANNVDTDIVGGPKDSFSGTMSTEHLTRVGQIKGKVPYMSPEQARGEDLDGRSDVFSLGVMLFELSTGRRLFRGPNEAETLKMITDGEYPRPASVNPRISSELERVIMKALAKDRDQRYQSARELQADLEGVVRHERIAVSTLSLAQWMQMLFEERLASQREDLLQGKQLADEIHAEEPVETSSGVTPGAPQHSLMAPPEKASKAPWAIAAAGVLAVGLLGAFTVRGQREREAAAAAERAAHEGAIEVRSEPAGASIWLNGAPTPHRTPYTLTGLLTGPSARYAVRVTADGFAPFTRDVTLGANGARGSVQASLERQRASGLALLDVRTTPPGATVLVDGRQITGVTPLTVPELAPDVEHSVLVRHPESVDERFTFSARAGELVRRDVSLRERPLGDGEAWITVEAEPTTARLRVGETDAGEGPLFRVRVNTRAPVVLHFAAAGYENETRTVRPRAGETLAVPSVRMSRVHSSSGGSGGSNANARVVPAPTASAAPVDHRPGSLRVGSNPWCNVTIDGTPRGQTPVDVPTISAGSHTVVCTNPEHGTQTHRVTVTAGVQAIERFRFP